MEMPLSLFSVSLHENLIKPVVSGKEWHNKFLLSIELDHSWCLFYVQYKCQKESSTIPYRSGGMYVDISLNIQVTFLGLCLLYELVPSVQREGKILPSLKTQH